MVQDHLHLSTTIGIGPEYAPDIKWKVPLDGWMPVPNIIETHRRTLTGHLRKHRVRNGADVLRLEDGKYVLKIYEYDGMTADERLEALYAMLGETVYLIDNRHDAADGADHQTEIKVMYMYAITDVRPATPGLNLMYVTVELRDDTLGTVVEGIPCYDYPGNSPQGTNFDTCDSGDFRMTFQIGIPTSYQSTIRFRYQDATHHYLLNFTSAGALRLYEQDSGLVLVASGTFSDDDAIEITANGTDITVTKNDVAALSYSSAQFATEKSATITENATGGEINDLAVFEL